MYKWNLNWCIYPLNDVKYWLYYKKNNEQGTFLIFPQDIAKDMLCFIIM